MDLETLRLEVRERIGELSADFFTDAEVDRAINHGIKRFSAEERWPWLWTEFVGQLASGASVMDLPADVSLDRFFNMSVDGASLLHPRELERIEPSAGFRMRHLYEDRTGAPMWYYVHRSQLPENDAPPFSYEARFIPITDGVYTVEAIYYAVPSVLGAISDEPMVPEEYQEAIPAWAAGHLFLKEMSISQKASEQFGIYAKVLQQARDVLQQSMDETVAWGREHPLYRFRRLTVRDRIPPTLGT